MNNLYKYQDFVRCVSVVGRAIINMNPENFYKWEKQCNILIEKNRSMWVAKRWEIAFLHGFWLSHFFLMFLFDVSRETPKERIERTWSTKKLSDRGSENLKKKNNFELHLWDVFNFSLYHDLITSTVTQKTKTFCPYTLSQLRNYVNLKHKSYSKIKDFIN